MKKLQMLAVLSALSLLGMPQVFANESGGACQEDVKRFCGEVKAGDGAIRDCIKSHEAELTPGCKNKMADHKKHMQGAKKELKAACEADLKQFCANVTPGEGREIACLKSYSDKVSPGCKEKMSKHSMKGKHSDKGSNMESQSPHDTPPPSGDQPSQ